MKKAITESQINNVDVSNSRPSVWRKSTTGESVPFDNQEQFDNYNWKYFNESTVVYMNDKTLGVFAGFDSVKNRVYIRDKKRVPDFNNVRIVERWKCVGDTYATGDRQKIKVFDVVRDFDESDIFDKKLERGIDPLRYFTKSAIESGVTIETLSCREFAEYVLTGIVQKKIKQ